MGQIQYFGNLQPQKLQAAITNSATTFTVTGGTWPSISGVLFVVEMGAGLGDDEKVLCSAHSGGLVTVAPGGRGYDGTTAVAHQPGEGVESVWDASSATDFSDHIYNATRDDHVIYSRVDGSRNITGLQHFTAGVSISGGGLTVASGGGSTALQGTGVTGALTVSGNGSFGGTLSATGAATLDSGVTVTGAASVSGGLTVGGAISTTSELTVPDIKVNGISGLSSGRFVGTRAGVGPPTSGAFVAGDFGTDSNGAMWVCTTGGTAGAGAVFQMDVGRLVGKVSGPVSNATVGSSLVTLCTLAVPVLAGAEYEVSARGGGQQSGSSAVITYFMITSDDGAINSRAFQASPAAGAGLSGGSVYPYTPGANRTTTFTLQALTNAGTLTCGANDSHIIVKRIQ